MFSLFKQKLSITKSESIFVFKQKNYQPIRRENIFFLCFINPIRDRSFHSPSDKTLPPSEFKIEFDKI